MGHAAITSALLIDSDPRALQALTKLLVDRGLRVWARASIADASDLVHESPSALILEVPDVDLKPLHQAKATWKSARVVVTSEQASLCFATAVGRAGADLTVLRPFLPEEVALAVLSDKDLDGGALPSLRRVQDEYVHLVLNRCNWNISRSARLLGVSRQCLQQRLRKSMLR